jgi:hypothetical protein
MEARLSGSLSTPLNPAQESAQGGSGDITDPPFTM